MHDSLAFTPVPVRARQDGWTPDRQRAFIGHLAELGLVGAAARAVGIAPKSAYRLRERPDAASFTAAWDAALVEGRSRALDTAISRALHGTVTPVFYRGRQIGERRRYNDRLLIAAIQRMDKDAPRNPSVRRRFCMTPRVLCDLPRSARPTAGPLIHIVVRGVNHC